MAENQTFTGVGHNPNGPDLPLSFGAELMGHPSALAMYSRLPNAQKQQVIQYVQSGATGEEALHRLNQAITQLGRGNQQFFSGN